MNSGEISPISWEEVATSIFAARGITSGLWRFAAKLRFAGLTVTWQQTGTNEKLELPTGAVGVEGLVIMPTSEMGPMVFDAAELNKQSSLSKTTRKPARIKPPRSSVGRRRAARSDQEPT